MASNIYHMHPLVGGKLKTWPETFARVAAMGFSHVCLAPPFAPGGKGDIFVHATFDRLHPDLGFDGSAEAGLALAASQAARHGLKLMLDIAPSQLAIDAPLRQQQPEWFVTAGSGALPDPRRPPQRPDVAVPRFDQAACSDALAEWWIERLARVLKAGFAGFRCLTLGDVPALFWRRLIAALREGAGNDLREGAGNGSRDGAGNGSRDGAGNGSRDGAGNGLRDGAAKELRDGAGNGLRDGAANGSRSGDTHPLFLAWTPGLTHPAIRRLAGVGFDLTCCSAAWWNGQASWLLDELEALRQVAPPLASPEPSFHERLAQRLPPDADLPRAYRLALRIAACTAAGLFVPMGFEYATARQFDPSRADPDEMLAARREAPVDLSAELLDANRLAHGFATAHLVRSVTPLDAPVTAWLRTDAGDIRDAVDASLVLVNPDIIHPTPMPVPLDPLPASAGAPLSVADPKAASAALQPGEVRILACRRTADIVEEPSLRLTRTWAESTRIAIEAVQPVVPGGDFPAKTVVGRTVRVSADVIGDGHDILAADLLWRPADEPAWRRVSMRKVTNDRWSAGFRPDRIGTYRFAVEAWWDQWRSYTHDLHAKVAAGQVVKLEIEEGRQLIEQALDHAGGAIGATVSEAPACTSKVKPTETLRRKLSNSVATLRAADPDAQLALLLGDEMLETMQAADQRPFAALSAVHSVWVDRPAAAFASWYELFPRSATHDAKIHGTFQSVIERLPAIRAMGFDVLYFPPIHPIGRVNRKGRNNSLRAESGDVGSPYAIGGEAGGHDAVNPALGTLDDFRALQDAAHAHGLELALDFAIQCAPDHPWVREHKDWFRWRPDGSMRYAENPPKKYEDIVNPDFFGEASYPAVWTALRDVIQFWVDQGVRIFRVDNPHTKPLPFWHWMIADIQGRHPDVLFLAEAFTRPKLMYRLAKVGFSQSYTYFTWRNTKQELTEYLTDLTTPPVADFFRPNFFVNTPDINPVFLQTSGRPGFLIRAALAATLSGLWGVYSGFEICESAPLPGREEYLDSEKYEVRPRDYAAPGNIVAEITALNRIRRLHPALQSHLGLSFYSADNDQVLFYGKRDPDGPTVQIGQPDRHHHDAAEEPKSYPRSMILVAVSFDPRNAQDAAIEVPLWEFGLPDDAAISVTDLMRNENYTWYGKSQRIRLDPQNIPFRIWRLSMVEAI